MLDPTPTYLFDASEGPRHAWWWALVIVLAKKTLFKRLLRLVRTVGAIVVCVCLLAAIVLVVCGSQLVGPLSSPNWMTADAPVPMLIGRPCSTVGAPGQPRTRKWKVQGCPGTSWCR